MFRNVPFVRRRAQRRQEGDLGPGQEGAVVALGRVAGDLQRRDGVAALEAHLVRLAAAMDLQFQPIRQGVDHRDADAVQAAGHLIGILVELTRRRGAGS